MRPLPAERLSETPSREIAATPTRRGLPMVVAIYFSAHLSEMSPGYFPGSGLRER